MTYSYARLMWTRTSLYRHHSTALMTARNEIDKLNTLICWRVLEGPSCNNCELPQRDEMVIIY
jgi:hypothetical protein